MLVLTRKVGESIAIGNDIKVSVIQIKGKQVRIGIEAPRETKVHREEVLLNIEAEASAASGKVGDEEGSKPEKVLPRIKKLVQVK